MNWRKIVFIAFLIVAGLGSGIAFAFFQLRNNANSFQVQNGPWTTSSKIASVEESMYLRAYLALYYLFALPKTEVIYFIAEKDSDGNPLQSEYDYEIIGEKLPARYWSITMYAHDHFLVPNEVNRFNFNLETIQYNPDGTFKILTSSTKQNQNWLPSPKNGKFQLAVRLYNLEQEASEALEKIKLPVIKKIIK